jgi:hypothetical protein
LKKKLKLNLGDIIIEEWTKIVPYFVYEHESTFRSWVV